MHEKDNKSRLGVSGNKKTKKVEANGTKPYAGEGGMKKLLARRRMEEEEENGKVAGTEDNEEESRNPKSSQRRASGGKTAPENIRVEKNESEQLFVPPPVAEPRSKMAGSREQSSLRVGRTKISRNHIERPPARPLNRFSARYADDEGDDQMQEDKSSEQLILEEAAKKVPVFEIPAGFTFAKEVRIIYLF